MKRYIAHRTEAGEEQLLLTHLTNVAALSARFAEAFGAADWGNLCGLAHDIGKYSALFQRRIRGAEIRVDHSTAGSTELYNESALPAAFCVAGHHGGLPDGGSKFDLPDDPTLLGRLKRKNKGMLEDYSAWRSELSLPSAPHNIPGTEGLSLGFFTRMLFSCLVDADFLDTEDFMSSTPVGRNTPLISDANYAAEKISGLLDKLDTYLNDNGFFSPQNALNQNRCTILKACIKGADNAPGRFTLTVPTGGGKTIASLAFALNHAKQNSMHRVIYVIPYCSIIDQTAAVFRSILGADNVLEHHSSIVYENGENADDSQKKKSLATENWDMPVIVTTAVQFFESLYASKSSRCRKLHNVANSVIIFDEAQMIPTPCLLPCVSAIGQLTDHYNATAVLCTATQPALNHIFSQLGHEAPPKELGPKEMVQSSVFKRVRFHMAGKLDDADLCKQLNERPQVLCIVNSRAQAKEIYEQLEGEGNYHLSTLMYPAHRSAVLGRIRQRLKKKEPCRVISTSLIEAGVDVDFPAVYRAEAGLDSILQAAGRCNREGKRSLAESVVTIFASSRAAPAVFSTNISAMREVTRKNPVLDAAETIEEYFKTLLYFKGEDSLDKFGVIKAFRDGLNGNLMPFRSVSENFHLIDSKACTVYIPLEDGRALIQSLQLYGPSRNLFRKLGIYGVTVYPNHYAALLATGDISPVTEDAAILTNTALYSQETGLSLLAEEGKGLFVE